MTRRLVQPVGERRHNDGTNVTRLRGPVNKYSVRESFEVFIVCHRSNAQVDPLTRRSSPYLAPLSPDTFVTSRFVTSYDDDVDGIAAISAVINAVAHVKTCHRGSL